MLSPEPIQVLANMLPCHWQKKDSLSFGGIRKPEHGDELLESAAKFQIDATKVRPILLDVTKPEQIQAAVELVSSHVRKDRGGLYGLFNNAGIFQRVNEGEGRSVEHVPMETAYHMFEVNYFGVLRVTQAFLPLIRRRRGRIIVNTSTAGIIASPYMGIYASTKFAVEALMDSLRRELLGMGVSVSILQPGFIQTPIFTSLEDTVKFKGVGVYAYDEVASVRRFAKLSETGESPQVTSEAVVQAMRSRTPKTRYLVGGLSGPVKFLSLLPETWVDTLMAMDRYNDDYKITDEELFHLVDCSAGQEFAI